MYTTKPDTILLANLISGLVLQYNFHMLNRKESIGPWNLIFKNRYYNLRGAGTLQDWNFDELLAWFNSRKILSGINNEILDRFMEWEKHVSNKYKKRIISCFWNMKKVIIKYIYYFRWRTHWTYIFTRWIFFASFSSTVINIKWT